jgi:hypothetical protein
MYPKKYFNRGQLINLGVYYFKANVGTPSHIIIHDVDMLPNEVLFHQYLITKRSLALIPSNSKTYKKTYGYKLPAGAGIYMTTPDAYIKANGFPNNFWGWSEEDTAFHVRYKINRVPLKYNILGDYISIDEQRPNQRVKLEYMKRSGLLNLKAWDLLEEDKTGWKTNGFNQVKHLNIDIMSETNNFIFGFNIIHLKCKLDDSSLAADIS